MQYFFPSEVFKKMSRTLIIIIYSPFACSVLRPYPPYPLVGRGLDYFVNARMTLAEMCKKNIEPMKDRDRTRTMNGSLSKLISSSFGELLRLPRTPGDLGNHLCKVSASYLMTRLPLLHGSN